MRSMRVCPDSRTYTLILLGLGKHKRVDDALALFRQLQADQIDINVVMCNALMQVFARAARPDLALTLFRSMKPRKAEGTTSSPSQTTPDQPMSGVFKPLLCQPDQFTYNVLIEAFSLAQDWDNATSILREMMVNGVPRNVFSYFHLLTSFVQRQRFPRAARLFEIMEKDGVQPDRRTLQMMVRVFEKLKKGDKLDQIREQLARTK
eukprot:TRINITY_DN13876_c0_g1_i2.p1 TRINITY_DN13876_c0_g1~~TRINITY_DN13876_c0_g1_i2.p1  ORF type:complete len:206 (+),score=40.14 TRINITY_DN13876_c0_g1_i2:136-753(+)